MVLSVPVPSSRVNCNSFFDFGTATHSLTFYCTEIWLAECIKVYHFLKQRLNLYFRKINLFRLSFTFFQVLQKLYYLHHFSYLHHLRTSLSGNKILLSPSRPMPLRSAQNPHNCWVFETIYHSSCVLFDRPLHSKSCIKIVVVCRHIFLWKVCQLQNVKNWINFPWKGLAHCRAMKNIPDTVSLSLLAYIIRYQC